MAKGDDYLEQLWTQVVDVNAKGKWVSGCLTQHENQGPFKGAAPALSRLLDQKVSINDLESLAAFVRYETTFGVLVALDDPGLGKSRIPRIHQNFLNSRARSKPRNSREKFIQWLWKTEFFLNDDGNWLKDITAKDLQLEPFQKLFPALQQILKKSRNVRDIGLFLGWNRYQACAGTLRLLEEAGFQRGDEPVYLHEGLLSAYPGNDVQNSKARTAARPSPDEPLYHIKSAQALAFSHDCKTLAVAGSSSPMRLHDLATGQEYLGCEGIRIHIYEIVFSPNGKLVTAGQIRKNLSICDAKSGKLLHQLKRSEDEISGLEHAPTGELICSCWCGDIAVFDPKTGKAFTPLRVNDDDSMVDAISLSENGIRLAVLSGGKATVWSWPDRRCLIEIGNLGDWSCKDIALSPNGKLLAIADKEKGVLLFDAAKRSRLGLIKVKELYKGLAFTPDSSYLIINHYGQNCLSIWNLRGLNEVRKITLRNGIYLLKVSRDGQFLAAATERGAFVWRLPPLLHRS
jgi:hypothetical protein